MFRAKRHLTEFNVTLRLNHPYWEHPPIMSEVTGKGFLLANLVQGRAQNTQNTGSRVDFLWHRYIWPMGVGKNDQHVYCGGVFKIQTLT